MLVQRLEQAHTVANANSSSHGATRSQTYGPETKRYTVEDVSTTTRRRSTTKCVPHTKRSITYEWEMQMVSSQLSLMSQQISNAERSSNPLECVLRPEDCQKMLAQGRLSTDTFGQGGARSFNQYLQEVREGRSLLMTDASRYKNTVRVVPVVILKLEVVTE